MFKVGDKVRFIAEKQHKETPEWYIKEAYVELLTEVKEEVAEVTRVKEPIRAIMVGDNITIKSKRYKYIEKNSEAVVLSISDKTIICRMKDGTLFTVDKKDCKLNAVEVDETETKTVKVAIRNIEDDKPKKKIFEVGDRVIVTKEFCSKIKVGYRGRIIIVDNQDWVCVEFDKDIDGHNGRGEGKNGHCWFIDTKYIKFEEKRDTNFTVGEWVRIRDWEDMEKDGKINDNGNIEFESNMCFVGLMRPLCGMYVRISKIYKIGKNTHIDFDNELYDVDANWQYTTDMIEKIPKYKKGDKVRVRSLEALKRNFGDPIKLPNDNVWHGGMNSYCGNVYEVKNINKYGRNELMVGEIYLFSKFAIEKVS